MHPFRQLIADFTTVQTIAPASGTYGAVQHTINQLEQFASFSALFDQYRITKVDVHFRPMFTAATMSVPANSLTPLIYTCVDYDDANTPTAISQLREYENCKVHDDKKAFRISYVPHCASAMYSGAFTSFGNVTSPWIDMASPTVQHYGYKWAITPGAVGQALLQVWNVTTKLTVQFKNVR